MEKTTDSSVEKLVLNENKTKTPNSVFNPFLKTETQYHHARSNSALHPTKEV